jgi:hypothetical protein
LCQEKGCRGGNSKIARGDSTFCAVGFSFPNLKGNYSVSSVPDADVSAASAASGRDAGYYAVTVLKSACGSEKLPRNYINRTT